MKYGAMNFPVKSTLEELEKIAGMGFDYFELTLDPPFAHYKNIIEIKEKLLLALRNHSMLLVCHLPTFVYTADLAPGIRNASLEEMIHSLRTAAMLKAEKAVLHPSFISGLGPFAMETAVGYAHESLHTIIHEAEALGIKLCFENMYPEYHSYFEPLDFVQVFKEFPGLKMTLDTGHANIDDSSKKRLFDFVERFPDRIGHIHISDNMGKKDDHFPVGQGNIDFKKFMKMIALAGYDDTITLEIFSQNSDDLVQSRDKIALLAKTF